MNKFNTEETVEYAAESSTPDTVDVYAGYRRAHYRNAMPDSRILVFLTGFCVGMVFFYLAKGNDACPLSREQLIWLQEARLNRTGLFEYICSVRFRQLVFCVVCALSAVGGALAYCILGWYGFEAGVIIFSLVYQYGMKGILLALSMFLPHGIFYMAAFLILFHKFWGGGADYSQKEGDIKSKGIWEKLDAMKKPVIVLALFGLGVLCETYVNPLLVQKVALLF